MLPGYRSYGGALILISRAIFHSTLQGCVANGYPGTGQNVEAID